MRSPILILLFLLAGILPGWQPVLAQNINGEKIQVAADALTVLKFNAEIKRYELGNRDGYTCQVRGNDNSIVIKTIAESPASTNLVVTEGKRTHYFIIVYLKQIDLNNTRLYYDYSDMKLLRKLAGGAGDVAMAEKDEAGQQAEKKSKKQLKREERERQEMEEKEKAAIAAKTREEAQQKEQAEQRKKDALAEQQRLKEEKVAKAKQAKEDAAARAKEKKEAEARQKELARIEQQEKQAEQQRVQAEKAEKERLAKINAIADAKERERQLQVQKQEAAARAEAAAKERQRLKEEKDRQEREAALAQKAAQDAAARRQKEEQAEKQRQEQAAKAEKDRLAKEAAAAKAKAEADARIKNPYYRNELFRKYPKINFAEPPEGQHLTGEYFLPGDTMINYEAAMRVLGERPRLTNTTASVNGITITIQSITFSTVNAYFSIRLKNGSAKDFLVGPMQIDWTKDKGGLVKLWAAYVTEYPVLPPGTETVLVFAARAVNASDADNFVFSLSNRLNGNTLQVPFSGKLYNAEMNR